MPGEDNEAGGGQNENDRLVNNGGNNRNNNNMRGHNGNNRRGNNDRDDPVRRCCTMRFQIILLGFLLYFDFFNKIISLVIIFMNPYFDKEYGLGYSICLVPFIAALVLITMYMCSPDTKYSRCVVPWAFLIAGASSLLIGFWVVIYITEIYKEPYVKQPIEENQKTYYDEEDGTSQTRQRKNYTKESKSMYILWNTLFTFLNAGFYFCFFFLTKLWVDRHADIEGEAEDD